MHRELLPDVPVFLCQWHVKRAWLKNLVAHVKNKDVRVAIWEFLGNMMYTTRDDGDHEALKQDLKRLRNSFSGQFSADLAPTFVNYMEEQWFTDDKLGECPGLGCGMGERVQGCVDAQRCTNSELSLLVLWLCVYGSSCVIFMHAGHVLSLSLMFDFAQRCG